MPFVQEPILRRASEGGRFFVPPKKRELKRRIKRREKIKIRWE